VTPLVIDRMAALESGTIKYGSHGSFARGACALEFAAYLAGEEHSDEPECVCPVLRAFVISWNDALPTDEDRNRLLKPLIPQLIDTRSTPAVEEKRAYIALDWLIRVNTPTWLDLRDDLKPHAAALRAMDAIQDIATAEAAGTPVYAAGAAARAAAEAAAGAAAGDAAGAATWAAARDAAGDAASAALKPTASMLQASALDMLTRMIAVTEAL
jgi:hypothetical protein